MYRDLPADTSCPTVSVSPRTNNDEEDSPCLCPSCSMGMVSDEETEDETAPAGGDDEAKVYEKDPNETDDPVPCEVLTTDEIPKDYDDRAHYQIATCQCFPMDKWDVDYELSHVHRCYRCMLMGCKTLRHKISHVHIPALAVAKGSFLKRVETGKEDYEDFLHKSLREDLDLYLNEYVEYTGELAAYENFLSLLLSREGVGRNVKSHITKYMGQVNRSYDIFDHVE